MVSMTKAIGGIVVIAVIIAAIALVYGNMGSANGSPYGSTSAASSTLVPAAPTTTVAAQQTTVPAAANTGSNSTQANLTASNSTPNSIEVNVALSNSAGQFTITPNVIAVSAGEVVTLNVTNDGSMTHNLVIPQLNVSTPIAMSPGQNAVIRFTAPNATGNYTYYCSVGSHRQLGMVGTLVVTEG